jgi:hypothetical protein
MTPPFGTNINDLLDSDPRLEAVGERPSHEQLAKDANTTATVLDLKESIGFHARTCATAKVVKRWTKVACVLFGVVLIVQIYREAIIRQIVRDAVREEMGQLSKVAAVEQPQWSPLVPSAFAKGPTP